MTVIDRCKIGSLDPYFRYNGSSITVILKFAAWIKHQNIAHDLLTFNGTAQNFVPRTWNITIWSWVNFKASVANSSNSSSSSASKSSCYSQCIIMRLDYCLIIPFKNPVAYGTVRIGRVDWNISVIHLNGKIISQAFPFCSVLKWTINSEWRHTTISLANNKFCSTSTASNNFPFCIVVISVTVWKTNDKILGKVRSRNVKVIFFVSLSIINFLMIVSIIKKSWNIKRFKITVTLKFGVKFILRDAFLEIKIHKLENKFEKTVRFTS